MDTDVPPHVVRVATLECRVCVEILIILKFSMLLCKGVCGNSPSMNDNQLFFQALTELPRQVLN